MKPLDPLGKRMKQLLASLLTFSLLTLNACASGDQSPQTADTTTEPLRFIVGFTNQDQHDAALAQQNDTLEHWQAATGASRIHYERTIVGKSWVIRVEGTDKTAFINALQGMDDIEYVEEDQIIRIDPIETRPAPPARIY